MSGRRFTYWNDAFLGPDHIELTENIRKFSQDIIAPEAESIDKDHRFPKKIIDQMSEMGLMGMMVPEEWGGSGLDTLSYTAALEEISVACASTAVIMSVNNSLVCHPIATFGTQTVKEQYLKDLAQGKKLGCYCLSEPASGSDAAGMKTTAILKGNKWVLNGVKNFITNGREAGVAVVYAVIDPSKKHNGIGGFVVDASSKGYSVGKVEDKLGINGSSTTQIILENVEIPESHLLGTEADGFKIAMNTLDGGRIGISAQAVGIARAVLEEAAVYSRERKAFGKEISQFGAIQGYLADIATQTDAARLLMRSAALKKDRGEKFSAAAAQAKLFASEICMKSAVKGIQILGGYGYSREYSMERHFRDAKITEIYEGTSEIQRLVIASQVLKEVEN